MGSSLSTRPADNCSCAFTAHAVLPFIRKLLRWYLRNCRLWRREPESTRVPDFSRGRDVVMCQPASHHTGLPARPRSLAKSVLIMDRMTNSSLSHMRAEGGNMRDPAVQSQRFWVCWEASWGGPHECGHCEDTSVLCLWQNKVRMYKESKFNWI